MINTIILGHALNVLPQLPAESVNCVTCSPPYWGLRDYGIEPVIWDGDKNCKHIWSKNIVIKSYGNVGTHPNVGNQKIDAMKGSENKGQFCQLCGAWKGSLGLEPDFNLYIKHLCDIFDEIKRVLRKDGTCFVNIGDSYGGFQGKNAGWPDSKTRAKVPQQLKPKQYAKCLLDVPYRFSIEMINRGWIKRNTIIWHKPNCMPSSADDRFTIDFEYLFFFTKNNKAIFWTNEKTLECVDKKPLGTKGIEGKDWEWRELNQFSQRLTPKNFETEWEYRKYIRVGKEYNSKEPYKSNAPGCKKLKRKKISFWSGHDYWFEQQFEEVKEETKRDKRTINGYKNIRGRNWDKDPNSLFTPMGSMKVNPQGRNKRCVWIIPTQPFPEAHFAVYPDELIETPIKAGCPEFICKKCGKARVKILEPTEEYKEYLGKGNLEEHHVGQETKTKFKVKTNAEYNFKGYTDCGCNAGFEGGIVLDPFIGSGTTAREALKQRKRFIGIDIKQEYVDMSYRKIAQVQQRIF